MLSKTLAAATLAAISAFAQGTTPTPCPPDTAKAKAKKAFGSVFRNTPLGQTIAGNPQPCPGPAQNASAQTAVPTSAAPPAPDAAQPKPGTSRLVMYNGQQVAIATGTDANDHPRTYVILPGQYKQTEVRLTTNPDVYVSLDTPPTVYTVTNGVLSINAPAPPMQSPAVHTGVASAAFGVGTGGTITTIEGMSLDWFMKPDYLYPQVSTIVRAAGGEPRATSLNWEGHDAHGVDYLRQIDYVTHIRFLRLEKIPGGFSITEVPDLPAGLDKSRTGVPLPE